MGPKVRDGNGADNSLLYDQPITKNLEQCFPFARTSAAKLIGLHDWSLTPLGPLSDWPATLRVTVDTMPLATTPKFLVWGNELTLVHNDA